MLSTVTLYGGPQRTDLAPISLDQVEVRAVNAGGAKEGEQVGDAIALQRHDL